MSIKLWKLINGEELIGIVIDDNSYSQFIEVCNPAQIILQRTNRTVGVGLVPTMPYVEGNFKIMRTAIAIVGEPTKQMVNEYNRLFGSGIQVVPASALSSVATNT